METKFKFKSQICTSREQSEKLLALGLKKETADMFYESYGNGEHDVYSRDMLTDDDIKKQQGHYGRAIFIPAWSLGRLWELYWSNKVVSDCLFGCGKYMNPYAKMIAMIEYDIEDGTFNNDYLDK